MYAPLGMILDAQDRRRQRRMMRHDLIAIVLLILALALFAKVKPWLEAPPPTPAETAR